MNYVSADVRVQTREPQTQSLRPSLLKDLRVTVFSLFKLCFDWLVLRTAVHRLIRRDRTFAFLVHPRTDEFIQRDVYGWNDIYRPFPAFRWLFGFMPERFARSFILWFSRMVIPITLSKIKVRVGDCTSHGYLLSTVRTPTTLLLGKSEKTRSHLLDLFDLASKKGVGRVGLGALLPSMTGYGRRFAVEGHARPAVSTGHAYTAYVITEYLRELAILRNAESQSIRVAIVGAGGSTGKAVVRVLKKNWLEGTKLDLLLVDVPAKVGLLNKLAEEARPAGFVKSVSVAGNLMSLREVDYIIVVTNASGAIIKPEHVSPGTVLIDDSQPRNTSTDLVSSGCFVLDVLARVPGLDCQFDFGFQTKDKSVTFTCLAETVLATVVGDSNDLAVGEVTDKVVDRMLEIVQVGKRLGLIGELPYFSFGRELTLEERKYLLRQDQPTLFVPAE